MQCRLPDGQIVVAQISSAQAAELSQDQSVRLAFEADAVLVVPD